MNTVYYIYAGLYKTSLRPEGKITEKQAFIFKIRDFAYFTWKANPQYWLAYLVLHEAYSLKLCIVLEDSGKGQNVLYKSIMVNLFKLLKFLAL